MYFIFLFNLFFRSVNDDQVEENGDDLFFKCLQFFLSGSQPFIWIILNSFLFKLSNSWLNIAFIIYCLFPVLVERKEMCKDLDFQTSFFAQKGEWEKSRKCGYIWWERIACELFSFIHRIV